MMGMTAYIPVMPILDKFGALPDAHLVPDILKPGLKVVFCGTAMGRKSAEQKAYYANPGNFFWRTLFATGLTPELIKPHDYRRLLDHGLGATDLSKHHYGNDAELPIDAFDVNALRQKIETFRPRILAFTSKTGAAAFLGRPTGAIATGFQLDTLGNTRLCVLPSPSGQARIFWDQQVWQDLADTVKSWD
jgi:TDG/mug DNA glycosylase family protein